MMMLKKMFNQCCRLLGKFFDWLSCFLNGHRWIHSDSDIEVVVPKSVYSITYHRRCEFCNKRQKHTRILRP